MVMVVMSVCSRCTEDTELALTRIMGCWLVGRSLVEFPDDRQDTDKIQTRQVKQGTVSMVSVHIFTRQHNS